MMRVLVTGANRGIGLGVCKELVKNGHHVLLGARTMEKAQEAIAGIVAEQEDAGARLTPVELDVSQTESVEAAAAAVAAGGGCHALVNNAGVLVGHVEYTPEAFEANMATNFHGLLAVTDAFLPVLRDSCGGGGSEAAFPRVINLSSGFGKRSSQDPAYLELVDTCSTIEALVENCRFLEDVDASYRDSMASTYRISKLWMTKATRFYAENNPDVAFNAVDPGWVQTDMGGGQAPRTIEQTAPWIAQIATLHPEQAQPVVASENPEEQSETFESTYLSGTLSFDGDVVPF